VCVTSVCYLVYDKLNTFTVVSAFTCGFLPSDYPLLIGYGPSYRRKLLEVNLIGIFSVCRIVSFERLFSAVPPVLVFRFSRVGYGFRQLSHG